MAKYVLVYHGGGDMPQSEEEVAAVYAEWSSWLESAGDRLVDAGAPIGQKKTLAGDGVTDGGSDVSGYSIIEADSIDEAVAFARGCPQLQTTGTVEVGEAVAM